MAPGAPCVGFVLTPSFPHPVVQQDRRDILDIELYKRGLPRLYSYGGWNGIGVLFVLDQCSEAEGLQRAWSDIQDKAGLRPMVALTGR